LAGLPSFAEVEIKVKTGNTCSGVVVGSQLDYRTGLPIVTGANKITDIIARAYEPAAPTTPVHTRQVKLLYSDVDERCPETDMALRAGVRLLTSIQESASGVDSPLVTLPKITFTYGPAIPDLTENQGTSTPWTVALANTGGPRHNLAWGYRRRDDRWPTVEAMMLDVDGDGLVDRVTNATATENGVTTCRASWQRNRSGDPGYGYLSFAPEQALTFGTLGSARMPMLRWQGSNDLDPNGSTQAEPGGDMLEGCALNGQVTAFHNSHPGNGICHDQVTACSPGTYCPDGGICPLPGWAPNPRTYLAYRWMDMDGDGLPELVAAVHGSTDRYDIVRGNDVPGGSPYEPALFGTVPIPSGMPSCSAPLPDRCKALGSTCMGAQRSCDASNPLCVVNWAAANTCVANAIDDDCQLHVGSFLASQGPVGQSTNGADLPPPSTMVATRQPYKMCNNLYPWFIFKNLGNGRFSDTPAIKYQPLPLESDAGDSAITGAGVSATNQGVLDLDGDGRLDGIVNARDADQHAEPYWWFVWPGDGTGGLGPKRYVWTGRIHASISGSGLTTDTALFGAVGLFDVNGDGLVDHWSAPSPNPLDPDAFTNANVALNDGVSFRAFGASASGELTATVKPGTDGRYYDGDVDGSFLRGATRFAHVRPVDVDNDGRPDMVVTTGTRGETAKVYFNQGGQFATTPVPYAWDPGGEYTYTPGEGLRQKVRGDYPMFDHNLPSNLAMTWQVKGDLTDLDGDGIPEAVHWDPRVTGPTTMTRLGHVVSSGPPRLLTSVNNGRGATTTIAYASMHDPTTVVQGASKFGSDGHPKASPRNQWVVKSLSSVDSLAATAAATTYKYLYPRHGADDEGYYGFRGFEEVQTTAPSAAVTVQRYSYSPDWSGRLAATLVIPAEAPGEVRSIDTTTWQERTLFSGPSTQRTYHPIVTEHLTCKNGQDENTCTPTNAAGYTRTTRTLTKLPATGQES